jgi:hypothetical protein
MLGVPLFEFSKQGLTLLLGMRLRQLVDRFRCGVGVAMHYDIVG